MTNKLAPTCKGSMPCHEIPSEKPRGDRARSRPSVLIRALRSTSACSGSVLANMLLLCIVCGRACAFSGSICVVTPGTLARAQNGALGFVAFRGVGLQRLEGSLPCVSQSMVSLLGGRRSEDARGWQSLTSERIRESDARASWASVAR